MPDFQWSPKEELLQQYLEGNIGYSTGLFGSPDNSDLAVLFKPNVGIQFRADFCVLQAHQGGAVAHLVEIESCHERLFTNDGKPSRRLSGALAQLEDWRICIGANSSYHSGEFVRSAMETRLLSDDGQTTRGVRFVKAESLKRIWSAFGGMDEPFFTYTVLIGRWSCLSPNEKARIINRNRSGGPKIYTYEQVARNANFRLERDDWHNDTDVWTSTDELL